MRSSRPSASCSSTRRGRSHSSLACTCSRWHDQVTAIADTFQIASDPGTVSSRIKSVTPAALGAFVEPDRVHSIHVFDPAGEGVYAGYAINNAEIQEMFRESLIEGLQNRTWVSRPFIDSEILVDTIVIMSAPIRATYGGEASPIIAGVVTAIVSLKPIEAIVKEKASGRNVFIVDAEGQLVSHSDPETLYENTDLSNTAIVRAFQESRGLASASVNFELTEDGESRQMLGTYTPIGDRNSPVEFLNTLGWGAIVQAREEAVFSSVSEIMNESVVIAGLAAVLAGILVVVFANRLSQPIAELAEGARRLASGDLFAEHRGEER